MSKILDLMEKRAKAWQDAKNFLDTKSKGGMLGAEDAEVYDRMEADVVNMGKEVARLKRQEPFMQPSLKRRATVSLKM
ncbi:MAG: hypothetical protein LKE29_10730 [Acidaminococcaceae bacterium]|jgi:hypothetical protein|nr:hypothetical protein [Acidaminococcaceae bacterium]